MEVIKILIQKIIIEIQSTTTNTLPCVNVSEAHNPSAPSRIMITDGPRKPPSSIMKRRVKEGKL